MNVKKIGNIYGATGGSHAGMVYDSGGLSPSVNTCEGGNRQPMIIEDFYKNRDERIYKEIAPTIRSDRTGLKTIVAMRGRNPDDPSDRTPGIKLEQRLEPNGEGICNSSTSVQKDNLVLEEVKAIDEQNMCIRRDTFGTLTTDGSSPKHNNRVLIKQATKQGYIECKVGGVADLSYPDSNTRRGRVQDNGDTSPTLTAGESDICKIESPYRIRKLTPLECWRLMGFNDDEFRAAEEVNSNTQLYKQAGNSIVVDVLVGIFKNIIEAMEEEEMKKVEEIKTVKFETEKMIDLAALAEKEPELFEELANDYPCEDATYIYEVKKIG